MSYGPQRPGGALEEPEEAPAAGSSSSPVAPRATRPEVVDGFETHLCVTCVHVSVCAVPVAIRSLGAEGQIVISKCAAFFEIPTEPVPKA